MEQYPICIIDDSEDDQNRLLNLAGKVFPEAVISVFSSCSEFLASSSYYLLVLLDIQLWKEDGIRCSREISMHASFIVYVTSCNERVMDAFAPKVAGFLTKSMTDEELSAGLQIIRNRYFMPSMQIRTRTGVISFHPSMVQYVAKRGRTIYISFGKEMVYQLAAETIQHCQEILPDLCRINQSELVNLDYVRSINPEALELFDGTRLYPSRRERRHVQEMFLRRIQ
ncbi:response regulator [Erysipelotrichaceae bacterium Oil+RF-744-GAM-WT-6]|uniref:Response regulator n=1 Tax=Stecheria intestinalis TaxID=2606630 RepID=A0A7X2NTQ8_9FIRM|nr:response regulator [Stecheria intestinalis]